LLLNKVISSCCEFLTFLEGDSDVNEVDDEGGDAHNTDHRKAVLTDYGELFKWNAVYKSLKTH